MMVEPSKENVIIVVRWCTISTDEYERADDGYAYDPYSDYYQVYNDKVQGSDD